MIKKLLKEFEMVYGTRGKRLVYQAPGRINLIGEHTDYNGGFVMPCAINFGTFGVVKERSDDIVRIHSGYPFKVNIQQFRLRNIVKERNEGWIAYEKGVAKAFLDHGYKLTHGFDLYMYGNIPSGTGLASSASVEMLMGLTLADTNNIDIKMPELARLAQYGENEYVGLKCGIMDHFAIGMGRSNCAMLLNCTTMDYEPVPIDLGEYMLVVVNSNIRHRLATAPEEFNRRQAECIEALEDLRENGVDIDFLCQLDMLEFIQVKKHISTKKLEKRAAHVVSENRRVIDFAKHLISGDMMRAGKLMHHSHCSLRDDYQVSCREVDILVDTAMSMSYVAGAKMTGAGFGGCTINLVERDRVDEFEEEIARVYRQRTNITPNIHRVRLTDGARKVGEYQ